MNHSFTYTIITPVKDEISFFPRTAESVLSQNILPREWIIVNDGSTDGTAEYIRELEKKYSWISAVHLPPDRIRKPGGEFVINKALERICINDFDFLARLDGDLMFDSHYFSSLLSRMKTNPEIGIAGGVCYINESGTLTEEQNPRFHVRGALKTYNTKCLEQIGGIGSDLGWDTIDEIKAHMFGWKSISFPDLKVIHLKPTRGSSNWYKARVIDGISAYNSGYHPAFLLSRSVKHLFRKPYFIGSLAMIWAFFQNYLKRNPRKIDREYINYIRRQQLNKLLGKDTIWK